MRELLANDGTRSIEQRVEHCRTLQYEEHKDIFAISHSSIHKAAADGSIDGLKFFLSSHHKPKVRIDDFDKNGFCPMHTAAVKGAIHSITYLVEQGCSPDVRSTYGDTALMHACKENQLSTISLLYSLGAQIQLSNKAGNTTTDIGIFILWCMICLYFLFSIGFTAIHMAAQADNVEALNLLVELVFNKHKAAREEAAALAAELDEGSIASESILSRNDDDSMSMVSYIADPTLNAEVGEYLNQASNNNTTPLHIACMNNSQRVVDFLLTHRVRLDLADSSGDTALHKAGRKQLTKIYMALRDGGASEVVKNKFGETPRDLYIDNPAY